jgi:S1-C subfamily serine protease
MSIRTNRLGLVILVSVTLCIGILLGTVLTTTPMRVLGQGPADGETLMLQQIYQKVNPSVVNIQVRIPAGSDFLQLLPVDPNSPQSTPDPNATPVPYELALASGFVYDTNGHIVTNAHVVQDATKIVVSFSDDTTVIANVVGIDLDSDLAVIKVDPANLTLVALPLADSEKLSVGERTIAIGNPFGLSGSMTQGIVSALGRSLDGQRATSPTTRPFLIPGVIQTDAAINPGNSGGPLLNDKGEVIGVNTAIESRVRQSSGVGFAVPSNIVKKVADALIKDGKMDHAYLGIAGGTLNFDINGVIGLDPNFHGVLVNTVAPGSGAAQAGVKASTVDATLDGLPIKIGGDIITAVDDVPVKRFEDLLGYLFIKTVPGQTIKLTVYRNGEKVDLNVTLGSREAAR